MVEATFDIIQAVFGEDVVVEREDTSFPATCIFEPVKVEKEAHLRAHEAAIWFSGVEIRPGDEVVRGDERWHVVEVVNARGLIKALAKSRVRPTP